MSTTVSVCVHTSLSTNTALVMEETTEGDLPRSGQDEEDIMNQDDKEEVDNGEVREQQTSTIGIHENAEKTSDMTYTEFYSQNIRNYIQLALQDDSKHSILTKARSGSINISRFQEHCSIVRRHGHKSDFSIIILIRFLYFPLENSEEVLTSREEIEFVLKDFSFWTGNIEIDNRRTAMEKTIFWSENHIFMYLSTAYLYHQYLIESSSCHASDCCVNYHDRDQLMIYLESHCHSKFSGVYEVLSCTYLPWTICALLNLYDFASDASVRDMSKIILDKIITTFCLVATKDGICNLTASARQYPDLRTRTWNHNINQLIYLVTGKVHDPVGVKLSPLGDFLATSSYVPPENILEDYFNFHGSIVRMRMNHLTKETREIYQAVKGTKAIDELELVPFYWSAGLITHPRYVNETLAYINKYHLSKNPGISMLTYLPGSLAKQAMDSFDTLSKGQSYTSIFLNTFKSPSRSVVMTSFDRYNVGRHAYQQNTWMVNMNGVGIWSQSGLFHDLERINISNPAVTQHGNILVAVYYMHHTLLLDNSINLFWPRPYFTSEYRQNSCGGSFYLSQPSDEDHQSSFFIKTSDAMTGILCLLSGGVGAQEQSTTTNGIGTNERTWWIGCRENMYVGVYCNKACEEDWSMRNHSQIQFFRSDPIYNIPRRKCSQRKVYWVVVVGDTLMYPTVQEFQEYCTQIKMTDHVDDRGRFVVRVSTKEGDKRDHDLDGPCRCAEEDLGEEHQHPNDDDLENSKEYGREFRSDSMCREPLDILVTVSAP